MRRLCMWALGIAVLAVRYAPAQTVDAKAGTPPAGYSDLLKENNRLSGEVKDLEQKTQNLSGLIQDIRKAKDASKDNPDKTMELEAQLAAAEGEKARLAADLEKLRRKGTSPASAAASAPADLPVSAPAAPAPAKAPAGIAPGSDLFKQIEKENAANKQRIAELEAEKQKAVSAMQAAEEERASLSRQLSALQGGQQDRKDTVAKLLKHVPEMEQRIEELSRAVKEKDGELAAREKEIQALKNEMEKREYRLSKSERMTQAIERTRDDVKQVEDRDRRDMHYNMATVYAKENRPQDAEREYLKALRIDADDADTHYNLGILYDQQFADQQRAAMHYRKYLSLSPDSPDAELVKEWLLKLETPSPTTRVE